MDIAKLTITALLSVISVKVIEWAGLGFYGELTDSIIKELDDRDEIVESWVKEASEPQYMQFKTSIESNGRVIEELQQQLENHLESEHLATIGTVAEDSPDTLQLVIYWSNFQSEKGKLVLNGHNPAIRDNIRYGLDYIISVENRQPAIFQAVFATLDMDRELEGKDAIGRLYREDFHDLFGNTSRGFGIVELHTVPVEQP